MQMTQASIAIAMMLLSGTADAQTGKAALAKPKVPVVSPAVRPTVSQNPQIVIPPAKRDTKAAAYSPLVDNVSRSMDQFMEDNTTGNEGRDHLSDIYPDESADDAESDTDEKPRR